MSAFDQSEKIKQVPIVDNVIDGKAIAAVIRSEITTEVNDLVDKKGITPGLAVILVGARPDSATYVRMKKKACQECGIESFGFDYPAEVTQEELLSKIAELNSDPRVHGILVQLPLPDHIDEKRTLDAICPEKDVDGLHPMNVAALANMQTHGSGARDGGGYDHHVACTPQGCIELLDRVGYEISGKNAVVIGRSNIVGIPVSMLLLRRNATVTTVHSRTADVPGVVRNADIVVAAVGRAEFVKSDWIKPGAMVIDVGINSVDAPGTKRGYRLVGDVDYAEVRKVAGGVTPVPGGVGPMTIAMLLRNTHRAAAAYGVNVDELGENAENGENGDQGESGTGSS